MDKYNAIIEMQEQLIEDFRDEILDCHAMGYNHLDFLDDVHPEWKLYFNEQQTHEIFDSVIFN
tara:strand:- start:2931 stop:3119 length:189 start_codon:yes stop_codon:yes gene_type:complete